MTEQIPAEAVEVFAALRRMFDLAQPAVSGRRSGKTALMTDYQTITRALAAQPARVVPSVDEVAEALWDDDPFHGVGTWPDVEHPGFYRDQAHAVLALFASQPERGE